MLSRIIYVVIFVGIVFLSYDIYRLNTQQADQDYSAGSKTADVRVVEFVSYECPYCREVHPHILAAIEQDQNVIYIPRPLPSSNPDITSMAAIAYAAGEQGHFIAMHNKIIENYPSINQAMLINYAKDLGVDMERLDQDINNPAMREKVVENGRAFVALDTKTVPAFVINDDNIYAPYKTMPSKDDFLTMFNDARKE